ncbi:hypothetical protein HK096_008597, partial [Nowakowskiella sp. JEL0078]
MDSLSQYDLSAFVDFPDEKDFPNLPSVLSDNSAGVRDFLSFQSLSPPTTISSPSPSPVASSIDTAGKTSPANTIPATLLPSSQQAMSFDLFNAMYSLPSSYSLPPMSRYSLPPSHVPKYRPLLKPQFFNDGPNSSEDDEMEDANKKNSKSMISQAKLNILAPAERRRKASPTPSELETLEKSLNSKERRQLRNKISARNFRLRRKEYITNLEDELKIVSSENEKMRSTLMAMQNENFMLRAELGMLKQFVTNGMSPAAASPKPIPQFPVDFSAFLPGVQSQQDMATVKLENLVFPPPLPPVGPSKGESATTAADGRIKVHAVRLVTPDIPLCVVEKMMGHGDAASYEIDDVATMLRKTVREIIPSVDSWDGVGKHSDFDEVIVLDKKHVDSGEQRNMNVKHIPAEMVVTRF